MSRTRQPALTIEKLFDVPLPTKDYNLMSAQPGPIRSVLVIEGYRHLPATDLTKRMRQITQCGVRAQRLATSMSALFGNIPYDDTLDVRSQAARDKVFRYGGIVAQALQGHDALIAVNAGRRPFDGGVYKNPLGAVALLALARAAVLGKPTFLSEAAPAVTKNIPEDVGTIPRVIIDDVQTLCGKEERQPLYILNGNMAAINHPK